MIINWQEEITRIDPDIKFRAQGGWLKTVEQLDKSVKNGYRLFRFKDGKVRLLDMVIDGKQGWAVDLWDALDGEL